VGTVNPEVRPDLEAVYLGKRAGLLRLGFLLTGSLELAEDAVQTAFVAAAAQWPAIEDPTAYLRRVVVN
jgi:DNA-directed RNA polymerase specialized sigma24 family protein